MHSYTETARAKVNLTLDIYGRRTDGFHELSSLVVFADFGDLLTYHPGLPGGLVVEGQFSYQLGRENLILDVISEVQRRCPDITTGRFVLQKNLPVGSGIGGGSADAAACIRLLEKAHPGLLSPNSWQEIAGGIGADVSVCMLQKASVMSGIGEKVCALSQFKPVNAILANPMISLSTQDVFENLSSDLFVPQANDYLDKMQKYGDVMKVGFETLNELRTFMKKHPNRLEEVATRRVPVIKHIKKLIAADDDCIMAAMSGSGPTLFGLYNLEKHALAAVERLSLVNKNWWVKAVILD